MNEVVKYLLEPSILQKPSGDTEPYKSLIDGAYRQFLQEETVQPILRDLLSEDGSTNVTEDCLTQCVGVAALQTFLNINWLAAPALEAETEADLSSLISRVVVRDGDSLNTVLSSPHLLLVAKLSLVEGLSQTCPDLALLTWALRVCCVVAQVLEEKSDQLHHQMANIANWGLDLAEKETEEPAVCSLFYLQCARYHCLYYRVKEAEKMTDLAATRLGLSLTETGALGKRTKYQVKDLAQFCIDVVADNSEEISEMDESHLVRDVKLDDDLRLKKIQFKDGERGERELLVRLSGLQQCVLMSRFTAKVESLAVVESLTAEEVLPYLAPILESPQAWSTHLAALLARSKVEATASRTVERSLAQLETAVEKIKLDSSPADRLRLIHVSNLPPLWEVERQLGKLMLGLGLTKAALDVFTRLEQWEEVIVCYTMLELRHKAAEVIRARLEERETARLWCLLGDATDELDCYHKALQLSDNKSARAYRSLGLHHYFNKEYSLCIPLFEQSLDLSSFQPLLLLRLAFSAMDLENWELAAKSYRSYCTMEMDNFEAWNNLANCYVKLGQKERAWRVLQESVRCDFENWKVWDNLMVISVDIGAFNDVLRSYTRILDIKQSHADDQVLKILAKAVLEDIPDVEGVGAARLKDKVQKLLARLTVAMPKEATAWRLYGDLLLQETGQSEVVRGVQCYQRSLAAITSVKGWERTEEKCVEVVSLSGDMMEAVSRVEGVQQLQLSSSIRLSVSSASKLIQQGQTNVKTGEITENIQTLLQPLLSSLASLTDRIVKLREG